MLIRGGDVFGLKFALLAGPTRWDWFTEAQLERGWRVYGEELTEHMRNLPRPGERPWGWWRFEAGREEPPSYAEGICILADLGELTEKEHARLAHPDPDPDPMRAQR
jgi:hypothetical protein